MGSKSMGITEYMSLKESKNRQAGTQGWKSQQKKILIPYLVPQPESVFRPKVHWFKTSLDLQDWQYHGKYILQ